MTVQPAPRRDPLDRTLEPTAGRPLLHQPVPLLRQTPKVREPQEVERLRRNFTRRARRKDAAGPSTTCRSIATAPRRAPADATVAEDERDPEYRRTSGCPLPATSSHPDPSSAATRLATPGAPTAPAGNRTSTARTPARRSAPMP